MCVCVCMVVVPVLPESNSTWLFENGCDLRVGLFKRRKEKKKRKKEEKEERKEERKTRRKRRKTRRKKKRKKKKNSQYYHHMLLQSSSSSLDYPNTVDWMSSIACSPKEREAQTHVQTATVFFPLGNSNTPPPRNSHLSPFV